MPARKTNRRDGIESDAPGILLGACILAVLAMLLIASLLAGLAAGPLKPGNPTILRRRLVRRQPSLDSPQFPVSWRDLDL